MPVVINELEVVPETAPPAANPPGASAGNRAAEASKPAEKVDFEATAQLWRQRHERVRAH
jgi:hypothetical protein